VALFAPTHQDLLQKTQMDAFANGAAIFEGSLLQKQPFWFSKEQPFLLCNKAAIFEDCLQKWLLF